MGNPVALDASADERDTRGFISMTRRRAVSRAHCELDVGSPRLDADPTDAREGVVAHRLVLDVRQGLCGSDGDRVAGVHTHGVEVLDGAHHDAVVRFAVAHDLELELLPARDGALDEDLCTGLAASPSPPPGRARRGRTAVPVPAPPRMKLGLIMRGKPIRSPTAMASSEGGEPRRRDLSPISPMAVLNLSRSSAVRSPRRWRRSDSTPKASSTPELGQAMARLRPVCPPSVGNSTSGRSRSTIGASTSRSSGST